MKFYLINSNAKLLLQKECQITKTCYTAKFSVNNKNIVQILCTLAFRRMMMMMMKLFTTQT